jgi:hypothetical protein
VRRTAAGACALACAGSLLGVAAPPAAAADDTDAVVERLDDLGCFIGRTADKGDRFTAALIRFQSANGLKQSGELTRRTPARLKSDGARRCDDRPVPRRSGEGRRVVLSQGQNWLWLIREDGTVAGQGGIVDNDWLPQDTYETGDQCGRPGRKRYNSSEDFALRIDYFVRFAYCRVGLHQIPVSNATGRPLHENFYAGTDLRKSHGCLRVPKPLVQQLWRFTKERTAVVVTG